MYQLTEHDLKVLIEDRKAEVQTLLKDIKMYVRNTSFGHPTELDKLKTDLSVVFDYVYGHE